MEVPYKSAKPVLKATQAYECIFHFKLSSHLSSRKRTFPNYLSWFKFNRFSLSCPLDYIQYATQLRHFIWLVFSLTMFRSVSVYCYS